MQPEALFHLPYTNTTCSPLIQGNFMLNCSICYKTSHLQFSSCWLCRAICEISSRYPRYLSCPEQRVVPRSPNSETCRISCYCGAATYSASFLFMKTCSEGSGFTTLLYMDINIM